jgi:hypothetical protein
MSDEAPTRLAMDAEAHHEIVPRRRVGNAHGVTHERRDPGAPIDVRAVDGVCVLLVDVVWLWVEMPRVGAPSIDADVGDATRLQSCVPRQKGRILPRLRDVCSHGATTVRNGVPPPPRVRMLAHRTPPLIER